MFFELLATVAVLVFFGIAQPNLYRTQLWQAGDDLNFNSSPNVILYAYANYQPIPKIPFVWSQALTNFNVAISIISLFVLLTKCICFIMHIWYPLLALFVNICLTAFYATSIYGQAGPDYLDPDKPSKVACSIILINLGLTIWALVPTQADRTSVSEDSDSDSSPTQLKGKENWEMHGIPPTPRTANVPYTPRTMAFNTLERKLPLRQYR
ncbi:hypothetical protein UCREL1_3182 [Eutypa lata UCREL1]|uniref:Integral membrane protein n=1 Tax=Eutypa lata (strain UCR-EL1) TaxID=1287681 RepID=M7STE6_EUTLA|nr:hypothetical protein UCREL1_3182 [Eutypa lata UCREL1]